MGCKIYDSNYKYADDHFKKDDYAKKAVVSTVGFACDNLVESWNMGTEKTKEKGRIVNTHYAETVLSHLGTNWAIQRGSVLVHDQGITLEAAGNLCKAAVNKCDYLPETGLMRDFANFTAENIVKPIVTTTAEVATHPETLTILALNYVVIPMLQSKASNNN